MYFDPLNTERIRKQCASLYSIQCAKLLPIHCGLQSMYIDHFNSFKNESIVSHTYSPYAQYCILYYYLEIC